MFLVSFEGIMMGGKRSGESRKTQRDEEVENAGETGRWAWYCTSGHSFRTKTSQVGLLSTAEPISTRASESGKKLEGSNFRRGEPQRIRRKS